MGSRLRELLDDAVARGLITSAQRTQLLALDAGDAGVVDPAVGRRGPSGDFLAWAREAPRGLNAISIAYAIGALIVLFALGWFLADRWELLGPSGILVVSLTYLALFGAAARVFSRERFATAHGVALLFVIATVPLTLWAALRTAGVWDELPPALCRDGLDAFWYCRGHVVVLSASLLAAALLGIRRLAFSALMIPGALGLAVLLREIVVEVARAGGTAIAGWPLVVVASVLVTLAYETDRRRGVADYARWLHIAAALIAVWALVALFETDPALRPWLFPTALGMVMGSLYLRRVVWLLLGLLAMFQSLAWWAREIFRDTVAFPVVLGFVGLLVIVATVLVQRQYPRLAERIRGQDGVGPRIPGGSGLLLAPAVVAVLLFPIGRQEAVWAAAWRRADAARSAIIEERDRARLLPPRRERRVGDEVPVQVPPTMDSLQRDSMERAAVKAVDSTRRDSLGSADSVPAAVVKGAPTL
jgi:hypothetical protein